VPQGMSPASEAARTPACLGRISWLRRLRLEKPLGHRNFLTGLKSSGKYDGGWRTRFGAVSAVRWPGICTQVAFYGTGVWQVLHVWA